MGARWEERVGKERDILSCRSRRNAQFDVSRTSSVICAALSFDSAARTVCVSASPSMCAHASVCV